MDFQVDENLQLVVETARKFADAELRPRLRECEQARSIPGELRAVWEEVGLGALDVPEEAGGAGLGCVARVLVNEELAAGDLGAAVALDRLSPALSCVLEVAGHDAVCAFAESHVERAEGRVLVVLDEDASVQLDENHVSIEAPWVHADSASAVIVLVGDELVVLDGGYEFETVRGAGLRAAGASRLRAQHAPIAERWSSLEGVARARARVRLHYASLLIGVMREAAEFASSYSQERVAFGKPIGHHQALAFMIVEMHMAIEGARSLVHDAAWRVDAGLPFEAQAASAWAECIDVSRTVGPDAVQVLGGHGFMADYPVEKFMREARCLGLLCGGFDSAVQEAGLLLMEQRQPLAIATLDGVR